jgi:2-polyprenyl-3-methyl-5-hydroxy-6-metoxy-1,4-benzoquinol methylase
MRTKRIVKSSPEFDTVENRWWNTNSALLEKVWAHTYTLQRAIRYPYLKKAKQFLQSESDKIIIWEVGCGTGWVCRMIADKDFHIIGTDFSTAQIQTAIEQAEKFNKQQYCQYKVSDASSIVSGHNGIVISAMLHHLTDEELKGFFKVIELQDPGTKVFLYEPVFTQSNSDRGKAIAWLFKLVMRIYVKIVDLLVKLTGKKDESLIQATNNLWVEADKNGWFLSPKEVPFYEDELRSYLEPHFTIHRSYFVNGTDFTIAQNLVFYQMENPSFFYTRFILPIATTLDKIFFRLNFRSISKGQYFFCCYELIKK